MNRSARTSAIAQFPLIWRWTSANHALFSESELAALRPCSPLEAARIHDDSHSLYGPNGLYEQHFTGLHIHAADGSISDGCAWLRAQAPDLSKQVVVSWDRQTALRTSWELFTAHWDDFCYPSSDDVTVIPDCCSWVLRYTHWEEFQFGTRNGCQSEADLE